MQELRLYQKHARIAIGDAIAAGHKRILIQAPCGYGKTQVASAIIQDSVKLKIPIIFVVDRMELLDQVSERLDSDNVEHGIIQGDHWRTWAGLPVQVCSIQTLARRKLPYFHIAIIDEAHVFHKAHARLMEENPQSYFFGLSATPFTKGLGKYFETVVYGSSTSELIEQGYLVKSEVYAPSQPDLQGLRTVAGDYEINELGNRVAKADLISDVVKNWQDNGQDRRTIGFAVNIQHSKTLVKRFQEAGVNAEHLDSYTNPAERYRIVTDFREGRIKMLWNVGILDKGFDNPACSCIIQARPTKSLMLHIQQLGRGLRISPGKENCLIFDHSGNHERLGFVTDDMKYPLDDGKKKFAAPVPDKEKLPSSCKQCGCVFNGIKCPSCQLEREFKHGVVTKDGKLKKISAKDQKYSMDEKRVFYAGLKFYGAKKGYQSGWSAYKYKAKFKVWPNHPSIRYAEPSEPILEVLNFIKHKNIRQAKRKEKLASRHG